MISVQKNRRQGKKNHASIDMAPLIDMVFILLIFFIVTSTFAPTTSVEINRPEMSEVSVAPAKSLVIAISSDGKIYIDDLEINPHQIESHVKAALLENPKTSVLVLSDKKAPIENALSVLDACRKAGADASIATQEKATR